jgi:hypothetical protein
MSGAPLATAFGKAFAGATEAAQATRANKQKERDRGPVRLAKIMICFDRRSPGYRLRLGLPRE